MWLYLSKNIWHDFVVDYGIYVQGGYQALWMPETSGDSLPSGATIAGHLSQDDGVDFYIMRANSINKLVTITLEMPVVTELGGAYFFFQMNMLVLVWFFTQDTCWGFPITLYRGEL